jgi:glycosyltransferase involved in cell wall biosynthesis
MPKKILFIIDHLGMGGAEKVTIELADYMARQGQQVSLAVLNGKKDYFKTPTTIQYIDLGFSDFFAFGKMWKSRQLTQIEQQKLQQLLAQKFDLIITGYNNGHWLRPYLQGNVWHWIHGDVIEKRYNSNLLKKLKEFFRSIRHTNQFKSLFNQANIITVSQHLTDKYKPLLQHANIITIHNGVDQEKLISSSQEITLEKWWDVIFVGRLHKIKQVDHALIAFSESKLNGRMAIIGDGPERQSLENLAKSLNILHKVDFIGRINNPAPYISASKCLILSSFAEGTPMCIAESLSLNIPVVTYACSTAIEQLFAEPHLQQGLVPAQNQKLLAQQLHHVVNQPYPILEEDKAKISMQSMYLHFMHLIPNQKDNLQ